VNQTIFMYTYSASYFLSSTRDTDGLVVETASKRRSRSKQQPPFSPSSLLFGSWKTKECAI
jgi:hypothetical protein